MRNFLAIMVLAAATTSAMAVEPLTIFGLVTKPVKLSLTDLGKLPTTQVKVTQTSHHGPVPLNCSGPALAVVLGKVKLALAGAKNVNLRHTLLVTADDGYAVALSLAEIDPDSTGAAPLLAVVCNGKKLASPRLVMPRDKGAGRAINSVVRIEVK